MLCNDNVTAVMIEPNISTFLLETNGRFQLAVDPMMWKDFPVSSLMRLTIEDFASFLKIKR